MHLTVKKKKNTHEEEVALVNPFWRVFYLFIFFHLVTGDSSICKRDGNLEYNESKKGKAGHLAECI